MKMFQFIQVLILSICFYLQWRNDAHS